MFYTHTHTHTHKFTRFQRELSYCLVLLFCCSMTSLTAQQRLDLSNYELVWSDEFDYAGATQEEKRSFMFDDVDPFGNPNDPKWYMGNIYSLPMNDPDNNSSASLIEAENIEVHDGMLYLYAKGINNSPKPHIHNGKTYLYHHTSSRITAKYDKDYPCKASWDTVNGDPPCDDFVKGFNYGIFEIRAKLPRSMGDYSSFWLWSDYWQCGDEGSRYKCDSTDLDDPGQQYNFPGWEIDGYETTQKPEGFSFWSTIQANGLSSRPDTCRHCATHYDWNNADPGETFHTYTLAWTPDRVTWFIDGNEIRSEYIDQHHGISQYKMNLILDNKNYLNSDSDPHIIDYVRVYRPKTVNYGQNTPYYCNNSYMGQYIWSSYGDMGRMNYESTFRNTPYTVNQNYRQTAIPTVEVQSTSNYNYHQTVSSMVTQNISSSYSRIYYTKKDGKLYRVINSNSGFSQPVVITTGLSSNTNLAVHPNNGNVYWKDNTNRLKVLYWTGSNSYGIGTLGYTPNDVKGGITVSPSNNYHGTRIYYISTNNNRLCYYEYCSGWYRHETPVTNVEELAISNNPEGKIFYKGSDNHVWTIWKYWDTNTTCSSSNPVSGWSYAPLDVPYDSTYADCSRDLAIHPDGHQIFYRTLDGELAYWDLQNSPVRIRSNVWGVAGNIIVNKTLDGRTEVFYVANNTGDPFNFRFKIKTYYERTAPQVDNKTQWQDATLDVFSPGVGGVGPNANYETGYYTGSNIALNNSHPTKVFCTYSTSNNIFGYYLGAYKESTNWNPLPQTPYEECLPVPFEIGNRFYNGFHIGLEGKVQNLDNEGLSENYETIETEEDGFFEEDNLNSDIIISPNPTTGFLNVDISGAWVNGNIQVFDGQGKLLIEKDKIINQIRLDISAYPKGIYLVRVYKAEEYVSRLILKQ